MKKYEIIQSKLAPNKNKLWLTSEDGKPVIKKFGSRGWEPISDIKEIEILKNSISVLDSKIGDIDTLLTDIIGE